MRAAWTVCRRECSAYFASPIAYIVIVIFLLVVGWFFFSTLFLFNQASLRAFFRMLPIVFAFVVPAVTMRQFAEEFHTGSYEILFTLPLRLGDIVLGKFLACTLFLAALLAPTLAYPLLVGALGDLDPGPVLGGYLGALLLGAAFAAVGLFASALTRSQIVAFLTGCAICFAFCLVDQMAFFLPEAAARPLAYLAADVHFENIARGLVDTRDVLYFASLGFVALSATALVLHEHHA